MRVKVEKSLQSAEHAAHTVVIKDDLGNNIFAATHVGDGIVFSSAGEPDFEHVLGLVGEKEMPQIRIVRPKNS
jgi:hypothetical protein